MTIIVYEERKRTVGVERSMLIRSSCDVFVNFRDFKVVEISYVKSPLLKDRCLCRLVRVTTAAALMVLYLGI
jgi:hypothetical protein